MVDDDDNRGARSVIWIVECAESIVTDEDLSAEKDGDGEKVDRFPATRRGFRSLFEQSGIA